MRTEQTDATGRESEFSGVGVGGGAVDAVGQTKEVAQSTGCKL